MGVAFTDEMESRDFSKDEMLSTGETNMDDVSFTNDTMDEWEGTMKQVSQIFWNPVSGGLRKISVGWNPKHVWGVAGSDNIYWREGKRGTWQNVGGNLKHVSVNGRNGEYVWGTNKNDDVWFRSGLRGSWKHIGGKLIQMSVGQNGHVWGVNRANNIYYRNGVNGQWQGIGGKLSYVTVGGQNGEHVWGVNANDQIYYRRGVGGKWQNIPGKLVQIEVSDRGEVYGVNRQDTVYKRVGGVNGKWVQMPSSKAIHIDIGGSRKHTKFLWALNRATKIFYRKEQQVSDDCM